MNEILTWLTANWGDLLGTAGIVCLLASAITAMTGTPADDRIVGKVYKVVEWLALALGKAKQLPGNKSRELADKLKKGAGQLLLLFILVPLLALALPLAGCNTNWPEPQELRQASNAAIDTYDGVQRMAQILAAFTLFDHEANATEAVQ